MTSEAIGERPFGFWKTIAVLGLILCVVGFGYRLFRDYDSLPHQNSQDNKQDKQKTLPPAKGEGEGDGTQTAISPVPATSWLSSFWPGEQSPADESSVPTHLSDESSSASPSFTSSVTTPSVMVSSLFKNSPQNKNDTKTAPNQPTRQGSDAGQLNRQRSKKLGNAVRGKLDQAVTGLSALGSRKKEVAEKTNKEIEDSGSNAANVPSLGASVFNWIEELSVGESPNPPPPVVEKKKSSSLFNRSDAQVLPTSTPPTRKDRHDISAKAAAEMKAQLKKAADMTAQLKALVAKKKMEMEVEKKEKKWEKKEAKAVAAESKRKEREQIREAKELVKKLQLMDLNIIEEEEADPDQSTQSLHNKYGMDIGIEYSLSLYDGSRRSKQSSGRPRSSHDKYDMENAAKPKGPDAAQLVQQRTKELDDAVTEALSGLDLFGDEKKEIVENKSKKIGGSGSNVAYVIREKSAGPSEVDQVKGPIFDPNHQGYTFSKHGIPPPQQSNRTGNCGEPPPRQYNLVSPSQAPPNRKDDTNLKRRGEGGRHSGRDRKGRGDRHDNRKPSYYRRGEDDSVSIGSGGSGGSRYGADSVSTGLLSQIATVASKMSGSASTSSHEVDDDFSSASSENSATPTVRIANPPTVVATKEHTTAPPPTTPDEINATASYDRYVPRYSYACL